MPTRSPRSVTARDSLIASAAVRALGSASGDEVRHTLEAALKHEDSRVRANAVEALQQHKSTAHVLELVDMAERDESRPRANAIGALIQMRTGDALGSLSRMLDDTRANQRISALWLVEHMGIIDVARQVAEMSISDGNEKVRDRAERAVRQLIQVMSHTAERIGDHRGEDAA